MVPRPDPFEQFAAQNGLHVSMMELSAAPRDVLAPPADLERYILATLTGSTANVSRVCSLFVTDATGSEPPTIRDILWWLSSDSWAIEQAGHDFDQWAAMYQYQKDDPAALRLFRLHLSQSASLSVLLGNKRHATLLSLYEREVNRNS